MSWKVIKPDYVKAFSSLDDLNKHIEADPDSRIQQIHSWRNGILVHFTHEPSIAWQLQRLCLAVEEQTEATMAMLGVEPAPEEDNSMGVL